MNSSETPLLQICGSHFHLFYTSADKPQKFLSYLKAGKNPNVKLINCRLLEPQNLTFTR